ncbi:unnamed protein product [Microthlaspi erraticum]|uniref:F-box domain-containing protein n=1 Tax=Microthlaspi erraticum TaxID=1685480 RepID=A0A6D2JLR8_9BRAS|nr:unnamed protein product [Microthlaspi erraticum]
MSQPEQLPWDLVGEILCRVPTKYLARFRTVCKQWKAVWEDKSFLNKYLSRARPQFMIRTDSKICSVEISIDDKNEDNMSIVERDVTLEYECKTYTNLCYCDGFVLYGMCKKGFVIWNPWVRQHRFIENQEYTFGGVGYDNIRPERGYKIFGYNFYTDRSSGQFQSNVAIYECKSDAWKFINGTREEPHGIMPDSIMSLNGNLYFIAFDTKAYKYFIQSFDMSEDIFKTICAFPSIEGSFSTQALAVFRGDRLSLLMQSRLSNKVEIFVTKQKVDGNGEALVWINFMTVSIPNFPRLLPHYLSPDPSFFVDNKDDKRLFVCACDGTEHPCIYIVKGDVLRKISIDTLFVNMFTCFRSYIPSFISIPCCVPCV